MDKIYLTSKLAEAIRLVLQSNIRAALEVVDSITVHLRKELQRNAGEVDQSTRR